MFAHGTTELPEGRPEGHSPRPGLAVRRLAEGLRRGSERPRRIQGWVIAVSAAAAALFLAAGVVLSFLFWSPQNAPDATSVYAWLTAVSTATALGVAALAYERHRALVDVRRSEASLQHLYESISDGVFRSTLDGRMISANPALVRLNGYANEAEFVRNCTDIANEWYVDPNRRAEIHQMVLEHGQVTSIVSEVYRHKTRERIWIEENVRLVRDQKTREPLYYDGTVREVTETIRRLDIQDRYNKITSIMSGFLLQLRYRPDGTYSMPYASSGIYNLCGIHPEDVAEDSTPFRDLLHPDDAERVGQAIMHSRDTLTPFQQEHRLRLEDGTERWVLGHSVPERQADGSTLWHGYLIDISDKKRSEAKVQELAYFDTLTHLPNRILLRERLQQALSEAREPNSALLFVDLDHFKVLNDTKGHHVGDLLLLEVAKRICDCLDSADFVSRLGGDEFVVLLNGLSGTAKDAEATVRAVGHRLLSAIDQPFHFGEETFQTTASIGAVLLSEADQEFDDVLRRADLAMYEAKGAGRGTLRFFEEAMQIAAADRLALTSELRRAPHREGDLVLYYQPIVDASGRCLSAEALLRWNHPTRGLISAGEFIPLAERSGLIGSIDKWVLRAACATLKEWESDPRTSELKLAVNVSAHEMHRMEFAEIVEDALTESGARADRLTLELTEHVMLSDIDAVTAVMQRLQGLGLDFALDDFGTGYSSLSYLKRLPIDTLKIDRSFVRDIESDENDRELVQTIMNMARSLKVAVIAEGVETELQTILLRQFGCRRFQGYLFGRPMPEEDFRAHVEAMNAGGDGPLTRASA
jgi:diguanylate cyclase (GGDEF)-like protein/PAS domain S-box-containing protein